MLQCGPFPQQTISGILVGAVGLNGAWAAELVLVWATAETIAAESRKIVT
jgi:hypothetical protein